MKAFDSNLRNEAVRWQEKLFCRSVRRKNRLRKLQQLLGTTSNQDCLEITSGDGMISRHLRRDGGHWKTLATGAEALEAVRYFIDDSASVLNGSSVDAPDQSVDVVVIVDALERVEDDRAFIRECHRVLRPDGRLIITTRCKRYLSLCSLLRGLCGLSWRKTGMVRPGYTTHEFFDVLKDGFDVPETITYSSCCLELPGLFCEAAANKLADGAYCMPPAEANTEQFYHYTKLNLFAALLSPPMWLCAKLDSLLNVVLPGHNIAAKTKRRVWRERRAPQLIDGRSIAEAALNTKIGTAAPF